MNRQSAYQPAGTGHVRRARKAYILPRWSVRHARLLEGVYRVLSDILLGLHPLWKLIGYHRAERPVVVVERLVKGFLFDCRMCGHCVLTSTGMSCPMNCPKQLLNGPCGGVGADGMCEVEPDMPCVWTEAWKGSRMMKQGDLIMEVQMPLDQSLRETSSWLRATAKRAAEKAAARKEGK